MHRRGITIIEIVVILAIIAVLVAILTPNIIVPIRQGPKTQDISNLKNLVGIYISGQTENKQAPKSKGHRFWFAMFVGDPASIEGGLKIEDAYASPSLAGNLICPEDKAIIKSKEEITKAFQNAVTNGIHGWDKLPGQDNEYTSYAGPRSRKAFVDKHSAIVGCDGSRNGTGFFVDGFATVNASQGAEFKLYEELAERHSDEWTGEEEEPNWKSTLLKNVLNIEASKN